ncbi:hypothetical protein MN608_09183 [Microdochium nivale]|nr:hypothetical protein MN608_09183 [Microdochium nivale]
MQTRDNLVQALLVLLAVGARSVSAKCIPKYGTLSSSLTSTAVDRYSTQSQDAYSTGTTLQSLSTWTVTPTTTSFDMYSTSSGAAYSTTIVSTITSTATSETVSSTSTVAVSSTTTSMSSSTTSEMVSSTTSEVVSLTTSEIASTTSSLVPRPTATVINPGYDDADLGPWRLSGSASVSSDSTLPKRSAPNVLIFRPQSEPLGAVSQTIDNLDTALSYDVTVYYYKFDSPQIGRRCTFSMYLGGVLLRSIVMALPKSPDWEELTVSIQPTSESEDLIFTYTCPAGITLSRLLIDDVSITVA